VISSRKKLFFYGLSFTEGGAVMATELLGAKLLAPYFGTSLYVWTCVMALTLGGLACGYFFGGRLSQKENHENILLRVVLLSAIYMCCLPFFSPFFLYLTSFTSLIPSVLVSSAVVLFPPVFLMGMVSPLLIKSLTTSKEESGKKAGEIYAVSTAGGILFCFLTGFYLIPQWGINYSLFFTSVVLAIFPCVYFIRLKMFVPVVIYLLCAAGILYSSAKKTESVYLAEGLLGKLEVRDNLYQKSATEKPDYCRLLLINNIIQSAVSLNSGESQLAYTSLIKTNIDTIGFKPKSALLLGLGGGVFANELCKQNIKVTAIELDERIAMVAKKYFHLPESVNIIQDDARHALYQLKEKYDLVMLDLFSGEVTPSHVFSVESFEKIKSLMNENGLIIINSYGYLREKSGLGNLILLNTLQKAGFNYKICYVGAKEKEDFRNFEIFASVKPITQNLLALVEDKVPDLSNIPLNTDQNPTLEFANAKAAKLWRYNYIRNFIAAK
jgi:predicted membrane-bound spermidine synthase